MTDLSSYRGRIIDLLVNIPPPGGGQYGAMQALTPGGSAADASKFPAAYLFKNAPKVPDGVDPATYVLGEMDRWGVGRALVDVTDAEGPGAAAVRARPERFLGSYNVDPNQGMAGVRAFEAAVRSGLAVAATASPTFYVPQVPINDKRFYPLYAKCVELDVPIFVTAGVPGPRVPMMAQHVELIDEVCWFFPELKFVIRHGAEPWVDLAVKLLLKWPNLYYSTSGFAPRHYPREILEFADTRGASKVLYAGYFPVGLTLERIFSELPDLPLKPEVWPAFLFGNAEALLKLEPGA